MWGKWMCACRSLDERIEALLLGGDVVMIDMARPPPMRIIYGIGIYVDLGGGYGWVYMCA